jgi:hypothetical protein
MTGVMARRSLKSSLIVWRDTPKAVAIDVAFILKSGMKSSLSISPGCVGGISLLVVFDVAIFHLLSGNLFFNIVGIAIYETETDSPLFVN